jgi:hypothetical protein
MSDFRLLIADDDEQELNVCRESVTRYQDEKHRDIALVQCKTVDEALQKLDNSFDGAIIDLKFADQGNEGNQIIRRIVESQFRIPVAILTGTPGTADSGFSYIGVFKKGETGYNDILDVFFGIYDTGLTRIMGGRGIIEENLNKVFLHNLLPQSDTWVTYGKNSPSKTEKALLRFILNHLTQLLDDDEDLCFPEEAYIYPPLHDGLKTGCIVKQKGTQGLCVVLNPACDLIIRGSGQFNTDRILFVGIDEPSKVYDHILEKLKTEGEKTEKLKTILSNRHTLYHHWLPKTDFFPGGFINFRKLTTLTKKEYEKQFEKPHIQVSPHFVKDILSRFSSYYARQGQPDIQCDKIIGEIIAEQGESG